VSRILIGKCFDDEGGKMYRNVRTNSHFIFIIYCFKGFWFESDLLGFQNLVGLVGANHLRL